MSLDSIGEEGGPFQNRAQSYTLSNEAARSVPYIVNIDYHGTSADWLTVSSSEGEIEADSDQVVTISLSEATGSLAPGDYRATISFETNGEQILRSATLNVASTTGGSGPEHTLTVVKQGPGDGTVSGGGIHCGPGCSSQSVQVPDGQSITLTATPYGDSIFNGFAGWRCYGTEDCVLTMNSDIEQAVSFGLPESLRVLYTSPVDGDFSMTSNPMFYFNRPVNPGPSFYDATIMGPNGTDFPVNPVIHESSSPSRHRLFLLSEISLERGETYTATIPAGAVVDDDGNPLPLAHSIQWTAPLADQPPMYVSVMPRYAVENERIKLSVWFDTPADVDRPIYLNNPDGLLEHISEIYLPAGETLIEEFIDVALSHGSTENEQAELTVASPGYGQQSVVVSIGNLTSSHSSSRVVAIGVTDEDDGDGAFEAGESADILFEVINTGSIGEYVVLHFSIANASSSALWFLGGEGGQYCHIGYLAPNDYGSCSPGSLKADDDLPGGDYYIRIEGKDQYGNLLFVNQESVRIVNQTIPDYTVDLGPVTSNELDPGREIEINVHTKNYSDGFDPAMVPFQVILEIEGEERILYDTYTDARGYITGSRTFRLPIVYPSVPGEHALWARINPPGPGQLAESDHSNNDSSIRILRVKAPNVAPEIQPIGGPFSVASGEPFTLTVGATDDDGDTVTFSLGPTAPSGMVIDSASGLLSWNPQCGQEGTISVEILATDDEGAFDSKSIVLDVVTLADLAVELTPSTLEAQVGTTVEWTLAITNQGPSCVVGARVNQTAPSGFSSSEWTCTASAGSFCRSAGSGHLDESVDLQASGTAIFTWTAETSDGATGTAALTGAVAIPGEGMDPDSNNDASTATVVFIEADCHPPASGDWIVTESCEFTHQAAAPADVVVEPGVVLTIAPGAILEIDLHNRKLLVKDTGGVLVQDGGTIRQTTGTLQP